MSNALVPGEAAPDFTATAVGGAYGEGKPVKLSALEGLTVVLYFYPKDDTPGCTAQACAVRDHYTKLTKSGALIFGVSIDSVESHLKFIKKHSLPFPLVSDEGHSIAEAYGVWVEKSMYGKTFMGVERSTFIVGPDGAIKSIFRKVKPEEHAEILLGDLEHFEP